MRSFALLILVLACSGGPARPADPVPPAADAPVACQKDADCPIPPCGPCQRGAVIHERDVLMECAVDPCLHKTVKCDAGTCKIDHAEMNR